MNKIEAKLILLGEASVGKSSIIVRYHEDKFSENIPNTIGASFIVKDYPEQNNQKVFLNIWDTCGQERFMSIAKIYYQDADIVLLVMDCENEDSLERAQDYLEMIKSETSNNKVFLVVNKIDLIPNFDHEKKNDSSIYEDLPYYEQIQNFCTQNDLEVFWVSAKFGSNIRSMFDEIVKQIYSKKIYIPIKEDSRRKLSLSLVNDNKKKKGCC